MEKVQGQTGSGMILRFTAIGTVLTLALQGAATFLGPMGILLYLFVPLPLAYIALTRGLTPAAGIVVLCTVVPVLFGDLSSGLSYLLQFGIGSFVLSLMLCLGRRWDSAIFSGVLASIISGGLALSLFASFRGASIAELVRSYVRYETERAMNLYREAQFSPEQLQELQRIVDQMGVFLVSTWPSLTIVIAGTVLLVTVFLLARMAKGRYEITGISFPMWKVPEKLIWVLILGGIGVVLGSEGVRILALNVLVVVLPIYFLQGLAIVTWFFKMKNVTPFFRRLGYTLLFFLNPLPILVTGVGIFDLWIDFRKPRNTTK